MTYRPITDTWILTRAKLKRGHTFYGAYPGGFPERARALLGVTINDPVLHVCGGKIKYYPYPMRSGQTIRPWISMNPWPLIICRMQDIRFQQWKVVGLPY